ncbi:MAG: restriction endonuclease [Proteobacteria bacterium]|nr:restriction endonuclease [Pseudomonadota bacterium]HOM21503.1 restriction endonuclease [Ottowia sp.]HPP98940.1 restriction endonuclease [Ottowia sp.]
MTSKAMWMVRAGEGGLLVDDFRAESIVGIGWVKLGDMTALVTRADFTRAVAQAYPNDKAGQKASAAGQTYRFVREIAVGDQVVSYDRGERVYLIGEVTGDYEWQPQPLADHPNLRRVRWLGQVGRDALSVAARNSLGAISTLFLVPAAVAAEIRALLAQGASGAPQAAPVVPAEADGETDELYKDVQSRGFEFIKDRINALDWSEMQELVAGLLRAMGYKTRISPSGSDRGKDIVASPDGLGFEDPRIVVEVKHRGAAMGSQDIRSFLGGRHDHDKGLYVSTGGFTRDARYEAERGRIPVTLMDLDDLVRSLLEHYEKLDVEMQRLVPLRKVYWPA